MRLGGRAHQPEGRAIGGEILARMRLEAHHGQRHIGMARTLDYRAVADMDTIEIPHRGRGFARSLGDCMK